MTFLALLPMTEWHLSPNIHLIRNLSHIEILNREGRLSFIASEFNLDSFLGVVHKFAELIFLIVGPKVPAANDKQSTYYHSGRVPYDRLWLNALTA